MYLLKNWLVATKQRSAASKKIKKETIDSNFNKLLPAGQGWIRPD